MVLLVLLRWRIVENVGNIGLRSIKRCKSRDLLQGGARISEMIN